VKTMVALENSNCTRCDSSTDTDRFAAACPERFFEVFISEQQLITTAVGLTARGYRSLASTFAAFVSRAIAFVRMAAGSGVGICINSSNVGVEIGVDGRSRMGLEDLALMQAIQGSTVLYPSDATSAAALTSTMADLDGISYLRTTRGAFPVLYGSDEAFPIGGAKVLRSSLHDDVSLVGAGVTVHQCFDAANHLAQEGISARVIDAYSVKPIDTSAFLDECRATGGRLVVAEDHHPEDGLGSAMAFAISEREASFRIAHLAVRAMPMSGTNAELLAYGGISAPHVEAAVHALVGRG